MIYKLYTYDMLGNFVILFMTIKIIINLGMSMQPDLGKIENCSLIFVNMLLKMFLTMTVFTANLSSSSIAFSCSDGILSRYII